MWHRLALLGVVACGATLRPFALRAPFTRDTDLASVSVPCRADPTPKEPKRVTCAPAEYASPFIWDQVDNILFARISRGLSIHIEGEAVNANSLDEVPDSAWFTNRPRDGSGEDAAPGACSPEDMLPPEYEVPDGTWVIDHGKDNGSSLGFRVDIPGKGRYLLKIDDPGTPEQASAASVIGAAIYDAVGFYTTCEQIVAIRRSQLELTPGLVSTDNEGAKHPFDEAALGKVLATATQMPGKLVRMQASKWLPGVTIGPFRYEGTRDDDPNDIIDHADRRELRGSRILAAWLNHWDTRAQNTMDVWMADDVAHPRSSPGRVIHYILDISDAMGALGGPYPLAVRMGYSYEVDFADIFHALVTLGLDEPPWDRAHATPGREKFHFFRLDDFDPASWKPQFPNPAFLSTSERDAAWMARILARFSPADVRRFVAYGKFSHPDDAGYLSDLLVARLQRVLERYLMKLSPLGEVEAKGDQICATDFARLRQIRPPGAFSYAAIERAGDRAIALNVTVGTEGAVCFHTQPIVGGRHRDGDPEEQVTITVDNGTGSGPLVIHAYDLGARGMRVAGLTRAPSGS